MGQDCSTHLCLLEEDGILGAAPWPDVIEENWSVKEIPAPGHMTSRQPQGSAHPHWQCPVDITLYLSYLSHLCSSQGTEDLYHAHR